MIRERQKVLGLMPFQLVYCRQLRESLSCVLPNRLEHPEAIGPARLNKALVDKGLERIEICLAYPFRRVERATARAYTVRAGEFIQIIDVEGRQIPYRKRAGGLVWFDFKALCEGPRSYADYVDLAKRFHTVMISGIPRMSARNADAARRFTWLVDVFYDDRVNLVVSSEAQPEMLFPEGENSAEFQRTVSRLHEMQSVEYLQTERRK